MSIRQTQLATRKAAFLEAVRQHLELTAAARSVGIDRKTAYRWREQDPEFAQAVVEAGKEAISELVASAHERALNKPDPKTKKRPYDERTAALLTMFLVKGHRPEFKDSYRPERDVREVHFSFNIPVPEGMRASRLQNQELLPSHVIEGEVLPVSDPQGD